MDLDDAHGKPYTHEQAAKSNGVYNATVTNTVRQYIGEGLESTVSLKRNVNSNNARCKLDGRAEARLFEIACTPAPEGHSRWTLRLLEEQVKIVLDTPVGENAIGRTLKKHTSTSQKRLLVHPTKRRRRIRSLHGGCPLHIRAAI